MEDSDLVLFSGQYYSTLEPWAFCDPDLHSSSDLHYMVFHIGLLLYCDETYLQTQLLPVLRDCINNCTMGPSAKLQTQSKARV